MHQCGIDASRDSGVPFGIRAIERGIQVEGIWISRSNTPEFVTSASRGNSSSVVAIAHTCQPSVPSMQDGQQAYLRETQKLPVASGSRLSLGPDNKRSSPPVSLNRWVKSRPASSQGQFSRPPTPPPSAQIENYVPNGWGSAPGPISSASRMAQSRSGPHKSSAELRASDQPSQDHMHLDSPCPQGPQRSWSSTEVLANQNSRWSNPGFEVLPPGTLGNSADLDGRKTSHSGPPSGAERQARRKLRKSRPGLPQRFLSATKPVAMSDASVAQAPSIQH